MEKRHLARHVSVVDPDWFNPKSIDVLGVGAVGLTTSLLLAKLGIRRIRLVDNDIVEPENLGPSLYGWACVDDRKPVRKVDAARHIIERDAGVSIENVHTNAGCLDSYSDVVFLCLDSNDLKRDIVAHFVTMKEGYPTWVFEGRMSERHLMVHSFDPRNDLHLDAWRHYCPSDASVEQSRACGAAPISIGPVAMLVASLMEQLFIDYLQARSAKPEGLVNQIYVDLNRYEMQTARWSRT